MMKLNLNKKYTQIAAYVIITAVIIYCLSLVADNMPVIFTEVMKVLSWMLSVIKPIVIGFILAYLVEPVISFLQAQFQKIKFLRKREKRARGLAIFSAITIIVVIIVAIVSLLVFGITDQLRIANFDDIIVLCNEYAKVVDDFYRMIMQKLSQLNIESQELSKYINDAGAYIFGLIKNMAAGAAGSIGSISGSLTTAIFSLIIGIYFLIDGRMIKEYIKKVSNALLSDKMNQKIKNFIEDADLVFSGYIRGQLTDALVMLVMISVVLSLIGVKFAVVIGVCAGIGNLIPYCGPFIAYVGTILICLLNGDYKKLVLALVLLLVIQTLDGNVIGPKLLSKSINIHPLLVIISLIFGSAIGGLMGMLLAVPVGAFLKVMFVKFIDRRLSQKMIPADIIKGDKPFAGEKTN